MPRCARQARPNSILGSGDNGDGHGFKYAVPIGPVMNSGQIVRAHQPDEMGRGIAALEMVKEFHCPGGPEPGLDIADLHARLVGDGLDRSEAALEIAGRIALERILRRDKPPDLIKAQPAHGCPGHMPVAGMGRIKTAAKQAGAEASRWSW